jgi:hypothetical protein
VTSYLESGLGGAIPLRHLPKAKAA